MSLVYFFIFLKSNVSRDVSKHLCRPRSIDLQNSVQDSLSEGGFAIFLIATYGEGVFRIPNSDQSGTRHVYTASIIIFGVGDPTDNSRDFVKWLKESTSSQLLPRLRYAVFGLGNRQYEHFNAQGVVI